MDHLPFETVLGAFQVASPAGAVHQRALEIAIEAQPVMGGDQDRARGPGEALRHQARIIALHHPALSHDGSIVQGLELGFRPGLPVGMGPMVELVEMHGGNRELPGEGDGERRLAGIGRAEDDDALAEAGQIFHGRGQHGGTDHENWGRAQCARQVALSMAMREKAGRPAVRSPRCDRPIVQDTNKIQHGVFSRRTLLRDGSRRN